MSQKTENFILFWGLAAIFFVVGFVTAMNVPDPLPSSYSKKQDRMVVFTGDH